MSHCKDCRWWERGNLMFRGQVCRPCKHPELVDIDGMGVSGYAAVPADGFGLDYPVCDLMTGPEFGCVKWEANE